MSLRYSVANPVPTEKFFDDCVVVFQSRSLDARDATGHFISHLQRHKPVFARHVSRRFDVGGLQSYIECDEYFSKLNTSPSWRHNNFNSKFRVLSVVLFINTANQESIHFLECLSKKIE